jgi:glycosidase
MAKHTKRVVAISVAVLGAFLATACSSVAPSPPVPRVEAAAPSVRQLPDWQDAIIYFVIVDRFADGDAANNANVDREAKGTFHGGDLAGLIGQLDYLEDLGVSAIWVTPIVKQIPGFVTGAGFPDWGYHGYWADDFYSVDPRFGTEQQLARLVRESHARGIRVLLDVVYNHAGYDSQYTKNPGTKNWLRTNANGECRQDDDILSCLAGLPDFKTELPEVADYLFEAHIGLAKRTGIDGFRLDTVKHVTHEFWQEHRRRTKAELGDGFFLIGELWGGDAKSLDAYFVNDEMDAGFDFSFQGSTLAWLEGRGRTVAFSRYLEKRHDIRDGYHVSHYLSSHDVPGSLHQLDGDRETFALAAALQFTSTGIPMVYYGEEVARAGGDWPDNRSPMPWGDAPIAPGSGLERDERMFLYYKRLIEIRRAHPALSRGGYAPISSEGDLLVFSRIHEEDVAIVAINRGRESVTATFPIPVQWTPDDVTDALENTQVKAEKGTVQLSVPPRSVGILVSDRANGP